MKSLILKVQKYEEMDYFGWLCAQSPPFIIGNKTRNVDMSKVSLTLRYHKFEVVTCEILDFEGQTYEEVDYFSWICDLCLAVHNWE